MNPQWRHAEPPYSDPIRDAIDDLEFSIDHYLGPGLGSTMDWEMDCLGNMLNELEASIEETTVPPLSVGPPELDAAPVPQPEHVPMRPRSSVEPPCPPQPFEKRWGDLEPPLAATPYFLPQGLKTPSYHSMRGGGTGIRNTDSQELTRWCPEANQPVSQGHCQTCSQWGDHGAGVQQCYHDWLEEKEDNDAKRNDEKDHEENT